MKMAFTEEARRKRKLVLLRKVTIRHYYATKYNNMKEKLA